MASSFISSAYYINSLLSGDSWSGSTGTAASVTYTYQIATMPDDSANGLSNQATLSSAQRSAAEQALQAWENVANIRFNETASSSLDATSMTIRQATMPSGIAAWVENSYASNTQISFSDAVFDSSSNSNPYVGSYSYTTFLHEFGHTIGLKHPGNYNAGSDDGSAGPYLPFNEDSSNASVMSYYDGNVLTRSGDPTTPMIYDIAAAQFLYGANTSYNAGNTTYSLTGARNTLTIWDGGGIDALDSSSYTGGDVTLDLRAGLNNITTVGYTSQWIAFNANIENATSGTGSDTVYGNALNNTLTAGFSNDTLYGDSNNDTLFGNQNNDTLYGGQGSDTLYGGKDNDVLYGGDGSGDATDSADNIFGGEANDVIYGNAGNDTIYGGIGIADPNDGADTIYAGMGNDIIYGNGGNDIIYSNAGNDTIYGGAGNNSFVFASGDGTDVIYGFSPTNDLIAISSAIYTSAASVLSHVAYTSIGAVIDFGNNNNVTLMGIGSGALTTADFSIV